MKNAHAPYSEFRVGAAILLSSGKVFSGCILRNVELRRTHCDLFRRRGYGTED
jgi:cytidine deaminase